MLNINLPRGSKKPVGGMTPASLSYPILTDVERATRPAGANAATLARNARVTKNLNILETCCLSITKTMLKCMLW